MNHWNQWVIGYDEKRQLDLLKRLGIDDFLSVTFLLYLAAGLILTVGGFALWLFLSNRPPAPDQASVLFSRYCKKLRPLGLIKAPHETALQFAARCQTARPDDSRSINEITQIYLSARYADDSEALLRLKSAIERFKPRPT